ncbi:UEV-domain-containing protein [Aspergillus campestris IBT 28561]|uniref:UEV-domain-containing protein n=1 Tax=Aspergillus campestris (strain IBT 28561) TaxID=1392248 RepID=A0A2I1CT26_ASPC2|nr:UEV-domain-containing protein [Aspergillus campestris IBT 28561]PKY00765.1 UEV-domain-containing protein [Aspergillus campestris IBT 28561]
MAAVPQRTLNWLYSVLIRDHYDPRQTYQDPNRTYYDVANVLAQYPSLSPRTDVYTFESGFSALLLQLSGTVPVTFRGTIYKFPISLWVPSTYPHEPPIVYVTPTQDMVVRVGQHVTLEGRVYHHYLAHWADAWERSSLSDLLSILRDVFAKEPPVKYKQPIMPQRPPEHAQTPPPRPPLPAELGPSTRSPPPSAPSPHITGQVPPPPPPKPGQVSAGQPSHGQQSAGPPVPPLPPKEGGPRSSFQPHAAAHNPEPPLQYAPQSGAPEVLSSPYHAPQYHAAQPAGYPPQPPPHPSMRTPAAQLPPQAPQQPYAPQGPPHPTTQPPSWHAPASFQPAQASPHPMTHQPPPRPKAETPDLLTSPFEVELPTITPSGPAPPIPPNPEKDALLQAVSKTLAETLQANVTQSESAAHSLLSQSQSLHAAVATLQTEASSLNALNSTLESNTSTLQQSLHRADAVIADAQPPPIDDVLVAPTVVGKQLYDLVAEERGIHQAIYALQSALVKGVISVESWSRHTRGLSREAFLKRALIRKIADGMGLDVDG